jgi:hypothetical protein
MKATPPSPTQHPNFYAGGLSATVTTLIVYECNNRLGWNISELEAGAIVSLATALFLFLGPKKGAKT